MNKDTAVAAPAAPEPKKEPMFALNGRTLNQRDYDAEYEKIVRSVRAPTEPEKKPE